MTRFGSWSPWRSFPDPRRGDDVTAPFGPGVYDLRLRSTNEPILFGISSHVAARLASLLPTPLGRGTRNNLLKREFVLQHLNDIEYRTMACSTRPEAAHLERRLPRQSYRFRT